MPPADINYSKTANVEIMGRDEGECLSDGERGEVAPGEMALMMS
jgi:hypothetical protein